ncbi:DUF4136 domain-containing protein [Dyadobacter frigoris]|uniref:DUF4136 domain-containing protein n=1 Tax=Dyadobacter frigoris TaxID=2576211 RepID=A0A4U6D9Z5_9BACT|nr:DUF4136 domain-containing protein [Dyadobacter frigoris]TKT93201.1 DUF4136 domain-containing protein [Dyadobacter frigoris]GLU54829.1 hypothetical protein Dfri01_42900 [Dyadobacter frigoris]
MLKKASFLIIFAAIWLTSCTKDPINDLTDPDSQVFITNHDKSIDFKQFKTFSIADSVVVVEDDRSGTALTDMDKQILSTVITKMQSLGYTYVAASKKPDVGLTVARITNNYLNVVSTPYSSYYGGYYGGYGYGYPSYYSYYQTSESYWSVSMLDLKNANTATKTLNVIWDAQIRGDGLGNTDYFSEMIDSIFGQSTYLKIN